MNRQSRNVVLLSKPVGTNRLKLTNSIKYRLVLWCGGIHCTGIPNERLEVAFNTYASCGRIRIWAEFLEMIGSG